MSAPNSFGRHRYGVASVLSTISGTPASLAIAAMAGISVMMPPGFAMLSMKIARVFGVSAALNVSGLVASAHTTRQSNLRKPWLN